MDVIMRKLSWPLLLLALAGLALTFVFLRADDTNLSGTYRMESTKGSAEARDLEEYFVWKLTSDHKATVGDPNVPQALIMGTWTSARNTLRVHFEIMGGVDIEEVPRTEDTKLDWTFDVVSKDGADADVLLSDDKQIRLIRR